MMVMYDGWWMMMMVMIDRKIEGRGRGGASAEVGRQRVMDDGWVRLAGDVVLCCVVLCCVVLCCVS